MKAECFLTVSCPWLCPLIGREQVGRGEEAASGRKRDGWDPRPREGSNKSRPIASDSPNISGNRHSYSKLVSQRRKLKSP